MNLVENVYEIAEEFMENPSEVTMNYEKIEEVGKEMLQHGIIEFPLPEVEDAFKAVLLELVASSVNYCYWYGKSTIRPNGAGSTFMREHLGNAFFDYTGPTKDYDILLDRRYESQFNTCLTRFINLLVINRFPLIEERIYHINQLRYSGESFISDLIDLTKTNSADINNLMNNLISLFPGFASDMFLKRASLFFIQLNRRFGWYKDAIKTLHVPADYQVPKMLEYFGCISYSKSLKHTIESNKLIAKNSIEECEIRSATILTAKKLCDITGWSVSNVDGYFFLRRHEVQSPFHLTVTTDY